MMESLFRYVAPPTPCGYLPDEVWSLEYEVVADLTPDEYLRRLQSGWRRFGTMMFHPKCPSCQQCQTLRVIVDRFQANRSQKRAIKANMDIDVYVGEPSVSRAKLRLYDKYHAYQTNHKGWPVHPAKDASSYRQSFVDNPFPTEEWCYYLNDALIGVGYVDCLPAGTSAIYFYYDPDLRSRSLGAFNVLRIIEETAQRKLPHVYLGYYVAGCASLSYKAHYRPNEILAPDGNWYPPPTRMPVP